MFDEEKQIKTNVTIYHILEDGVIVTTILVSMHGNANSGKAYSLDLVIVRYWISVLYNEILLDRIP